MGCRPHCIALVTRGFPANLGRIVHVVEPYGDVDYSHVGYGVLPCWTVESLGSDLSTRDGPIIRGHLPEIALAALPGISPTQARRLAKQKGRAAFDAAMKEFGEVLRSIYGDQELAIGQRDGAACGVSTRADATLAHHPDFPPHLTERMPVEDVLRALEFQKQDGCYRRNWGRVEFAACESPFGWVLWRAYRTERRIGVPYEIPLQRESSFVELLAIIYPLWAEVHPDESPTDAHLLQGKNWLDYQRDLKKLIPPPPRLYVKREFLRFALNHIAKQHDWEKADYPVRFSQVRGQLRIVAKDTELYCPANGRWVGEETVSARTLFRSIPKRFRGPVIVLEARAGQLMIGSHRMAALWVDTTSALSQS